MGVCASCLGRKTPEPYDEEEESRLLFDDPNSVQYGSFGDPNMNGQEDPVEVQRENEALQRVVANTSDNMVDIFEIAPQGPSARVTTAPFAYAGHEARIVRYQHLLSKLASKEEEEQEQDQGQRPPDVQVDWLPQEDSNIELHGKSPSIRSDSDGPLVGTFADAAAAMS